MHAGDLVRTVLARIVVVAFWQRIRALVEPRWLAFGACMVALVGAVVLFGYLIP